MTQEKPHSSPTSLANPWKHGTPAPLFQHYIIPCCFIITIKVTKEKNNYKFQAGIHIVGWASQYWGKRLVRQKRSKLLNSSLSFLLIQIISPKKSWMQAREFAWKHLLTQRCISLACWSTSKEGCIRFLCKNNWITKPKYLDLWCHDPSMLVNLWRGEKWRTDT